MKNAILTYVTLLIMGLALWSQGASLKATNALAESRSDEVARWRIPAAVLGGRLPTSIAETLGERGTERFTLVWLSNPERCPTCYKDPSDWNLLSRMNEVRAVLVETGLVSGSSVEGRETLDPSTRRVSVPFDLLWEEFAVELGSLRLLLDSSGVVIAADAQDPGSICGWSFEASLRALLRLPVEYRGSVSSIAQKPQ